MLIIIMATSPWGSEKEKRKLKYDFFLKKKDNNLRHHHHHHHVKEKGTPL